MSNNSDMMNTNSELEPMMGGNEMEEEPLNMEGGAELKEMNGGKRRGPRKNGATRKKKGTNSIRKKKGGKKNKNTRRNKKGGEKKSLNGLASVGALFAAQQVFARKAKKTMKKLSKRGRSKK